MKPFFTGIATALITPFNQDKTIDFSALRILIERQIKLKANAIVILGTTGEISTLSLKERREIINFAVEIIQDKIPIIFGIGGNNPTEIIDLGRYIIRATKNKKCKIAVMVTAPYYNKGTPDGIFKFYQAITTALKLPTIIYNIPARTGVNIMPQNMAQIAKLPFVVGIKEASGDLHQITQMVNLCPNTAVYCGDDTLSLPAYAVGCQGIISVASNIDVLPLKEIWLLFTNGENALALQKFQKQLPFYESLFRVVNPIPIKAELAKTGLIKNVLRLPLTPIE